jgi:AcrR family transcriptional regulator
VSASSKASRSRGRPRQYDPDAALEAALHEFWEKGFSATSLDDLTAATGMNRPSLYRAFGDKQALYRQTLARVVGRFQAALGALVLDEPDVKKGLRGFFGAALDLFFSAEPAPGCPVMCTAPAEALTQPEVRRDLRALIGGVDELLTARLRKAQEARQLRAGLDPAAAAELLQAVMHSLAIRARAGEPKDKLQRMASAAIDLVIG